MVTGSKNKEFLTVWEFLDSVVTEFFLTKVVQTAGHIIVAPENIKFPILPAENNCNQMSMGSIKMNILSDPSKQLV